MRPWFTSLGEAVLVVSLFVLGALESVSGQILYVKPVGTGTSQVGQLRQINTDGTGDTAVAVPFADVYGPVPSRDGTQFALSAVDPARPNQISRNVFTVNRTTGAIQNATNFLDMLDPDVGAARSAGTAAEPGKHLDPAQRRDRG